MKYFFVSCLSLSILLSLFGCSKDNDIVSDPGEPFLPDTLGTGWTKDSIPTDLFLMDVFFLSENMGYIVHDQGMRKTINAGGAWSAPDAGGMASYLNIAASIGGKVANVRSNYDGLHVSQNFGQTFTEVLTATQSGVGAVPLRCTDAFYSSDAICYAAGRSSLFKSTDGGLTFSKIYSFSNTPDGGYASLFFINDNVGWVVAIGGLLKTTDGGLSWQHQHNVERGMLHFINPNIGFLIGTSGFKKTTNGGTIWESLAFPETQTNDIFDIHFINETTGYVSTSKSIYKTVDGGATWARVVKMGSKSIGEIHFTDANHGWACGSNGMILKFVQ